MMEDSMDELVRELLDDESPFLMVPNNNTIIPKEGVNRLLSAVYSGPTIQDIENALSVTTGNGDISQPRGLTKIDNKYTLRIKTCASSSAMADDGYKWRKYGQKSIKNSPNPRSYYRCTNPRCSAKKQVERCREEADTMIITYEGLHLHFAYPYFLASPDQQQAKKPKKMQAQETPTITNELAIECQSQSTLVQGGVGLLEDMVPMMILNPQSNSHSPPTSPSSSSSSLSCSPNYSPPSYITSLPFAEYC